MLLHKILELVGQLLFLAGQSRHIVPRAFFCLLLDSLLLSQGLVNKLLSRFGFVPKLGHLGELLRGIGDRWRRLIGVWLIERVRIVADGFLEHFARRDQFGQRAAFLTLGLVHDIGLQLLACAIERLLRFGQIVQCFADGFVLHFGSHPGVQMLR